MRLIVLTVMGIIGGLGLAAAIVAVPVMAEKGPLRTTLVAHLGGGQEEEVPGGGDPNGRGRAVVKVFKEQLCAKVKTESIESSSKATINLGMSGEKGPTVANLQERAATTPLSGATTPTTTTTTGTTGTTTGTITATTGTTGTTGTTTGTTTATTGPTGAQQTGTTTTGDSTSPQATTTAQSTTVAQSSPSQSTASPTASASASASASTTAASASASTTAASTSTASTSRATNLEHTGGCVEVPRALSLELGEHPARFYVNVTNEQYPEGAIRGQLHHSGAAEHRSGDVHHRSSGNDDD